TPWKALPLERLEGDRRQRAHDMRDVEQLFGEIMPDILVLGHVDLGQEVVIARGRVKLADDLAVIDRIGDLVGLAGRAAELDENRAHGEPLDLLPRQTRPRAPRGSSPRARSRARSGASAA